MRNIRTEWFYNEKSPKEIKCPTVGLLKNKEDALCYLLALNLYPKLYPQYIYYSWILENNQTGYLIIVGNNRDTIGNMQFKFIKGDFDNE